LEVVAKASTNVSNHLIFAYVAATKRDLAARNLTPRLTKYQLKQGISSFSGMLAGHLIGFELGFYSCTSFCYEGSFNIGVSSTHSPGNAPPGHTREFVNPLLADVRALVSTCNRVVVRL
jgi:hypothetical protein